jgi:hypothetical protein
MRSLLVAAAVAMLAVPSQAQERRIPVPAIPKGVPSIMVEPDGSAEPRRKGRSAQSPRQAENRKTASRKAKPAPRTARRTPLPVPTTGGAGVAGINRSLEIQGQQMRVQDQRQFELNQIRSGSGTGLGCTPGSLGC